MATIEHKTLSGSELHDPKAHTHDTLYLKRAAADISTFTEKASPVSADLVIVEDSAASYAKKKVQVGNLPGGGGVTDHGALTGLGDDDHAQYLLVNGTRAMTGNLDINGNQILDVTVIGGQNSTSWLEVHGGSSIYDAEIRIFGKDTGGFEGVIKFDVPNAAKTGQLSAMTINGASDTPIVDIQYGLDMNSKKIVSVLDPTSAQDAATKNYVDTLAGIGTLGGLSDVTITSPASGDTIVHDGVDFKNVNIDTRIMATKLDDFTTPNDNTDLDSSTVQHGLLPKLGGGTVNFLRADGSWAAPPGAAGGETNTASNQGAAGVGVYYQKVGVDLQFKNIHAADNQISVADDPVNHVIDIAVVEANIKLDDLGTADDNTDLNATTGAHGLLLKLGGGSTNFLRADGTWAEPPGASGGEANTGTNVGTAGVGVFKQKTGVNLEFKKINAGSGNITITDDVANSEVDINVGTNVFLADGTRAMSGNLNMGSNTMTSVTGVYGVSQVFAADSASDLNLVAHNTIARCPRLSMYGTTYAVAGDRGSFQFYCPGAGGASQILAMSVGGLTDSPPVYIYYGLSMMTKKITSLGDPTSAQDAATKNYVDTATPSAHENTHESGGSDAIEFDSLADGTTYKKFIFSERSKLSGIELNADVTDATNVGAAGALMTPAGSTRGDVLIRNVSGWTRLAAGASGYFLKTQGAGADSVWAAAPGAGSGGDACYVLAATDTPATIRNRADGTCSATSAETEINAAFATYDTVKLTEGTFVVDGSITLGAGQSLIGSGVSTSIKVKDGHSSLLDMIYANTVSDVLITNLTMDGNRAGSSALVFAIHWDAVINGILSGCWIKNCKGDMICTEDCEMGIITGCISNNNDYGPSIEGSQYMIVHNNVIKNTQYYGLYAATSNDSSIKNNLVVASSQAANNTYADIDVRGLSTGSNNIDIQGNTIRAGSGANNSSYAIRLAHSGCTRTLISNNDCYGAGVTGTFLDIGTSTCWGAGNRKKNGTWATGT